MSKIFYRASDGGFYHEGLNDPIPEDVVEIPRTTFETLFLDQEKGAIISPGTDGRPYATFPDKPKLADSKAVLINRVKSEAFRRIDDIAPVWKQLNAARGEGSVDYDKVDALRKASNDLEKKIQKLKASEIDSFDIYSDDHWN